MSARLKDWRTTVPGLLIALGSYMTSVGGKLPTSGQEWMQFAFSLGMALFGALSKS